MARQSPSTGGEHTCSAPIVNNIAHAGKSGASPIEQSESEAWQRFHLVPLPKPDTDLFGAPVVEAAPPLAELPALASTLALLQIVAGPEMMAAALPILRTRLALTPEKLALLLVRALNPDEYVKKGEEPALRGIDRETLKSYKDARLLPEHMGFADPRNEGRGKR